jgi:hypothetical protein
VDTTRERERDADGRGEPGDSRCDPHPLAPSASPPDETNIAPSAPGGHCVNENEGELRVVDHFMLVLVAARPFSFVFVRAE